MRKCLIILLMLVPMLSWAQDPVQIDGIWYKINKEAKVAEITLKDGESSCYLGSITIPEVVKYEGATYSVTSIGDYAFLGSPDLTSIIIPNSVNRIGYCAFEYCSGLTSITIPSSVTSIGNYILDGCTALKSVTVAEANTTYDSRDNCNAIIETQNNKLIAGCNTTIIPDSVTSIGRGAFRHCSNLTSLTIPNSVISIEDFAFQYCSGLTSITIGNSVTSIGDNAFVECSGLTSIIIPNSVTRITGSAFQGCSGLTSISVEADNSRYDSRDNCNAIIETATNTLIAGCQNTTIPNSVTGIGASAFFGCSGLTSVTIPKSVKSIGNSAFYLCI